MQSLTDLNTRAASQVTFTDNRGANVIFDRVATKDYSFTETELSFNFLVGAEIVEIIQPAAANVRLKINVGNVLATITYGDQLPSGVTFTKSGSVYTFFGITSIAQWTQLKSSLVINIDASYAGNFSYEVAVVYNTDTAANLQFSYDVGIYIPTSLLEVQSTLNLVPSIIRGAHVDLQTFYYIQRFLAIFAVVVDMDSEFTMTTIGDQRILAEPATYNVNSAVTANSTVNYDLIKTLSATSTVSAGVSKYDPYGPTNKLTNATFQGNTGNNILSGMYIPNIPGYDDTVDVYTITLTSPDGEFGTISSSSSTYTFTGTWQQVNTQFANIVFYPDIGLTSNTTFTYTQSKQNSYTISETNTLTYAGDGLETTTLIFEPSDSPATWTPNLELVKYNTMDYLVVGGGGAGGDGTSQPGGGHRGDAGGGGGAGEAKEATRFPITLTTYNITVGSGGTTSVGGYIGSTYVPSAGGNGTASTFDVLTASGGQGGQGGALLEAGGDGGDNNTYAGGDGVIFGQGGGGGGGAGAGGNGDTTSNAVGGDGGIGVTSTITGSSVLYGVGGHGGYGQDGNGSLPSGYPPIQTELGSGGRGDSARTTDGSKTQTAGLDGIVIIKIY